MAIAIDRYEAGNILNPSFDVINWCIDRHQELLPRYQMLSDYYDGKPHKVDEIADIRSPHDKDEIYVNNAKYVTDMMVGFTVGAPISYTPPQGGNIDELIAALDGMRIKKHDKEIAKDISVFGIGLELQYLAKHPDNPNTTIPKIACIDPRGMFVVVDDTVERQKLFAVRYKEKKSIEGITYWEFNIYTSQAVITYRCKEKRLSPENLMDENPKVVPHYYKTVPVTEYRNNEEKQGDFEQQIPQIDGYNKLMTDRIKDKENFIKAVMVLYGFTLPDEKPAEINGQMILNAPAKEDGGDAEFLVNTFNETEVQVLADALLDDFHKTSYIPNMNDENFAGNATGVAMKYKLFGLLLVIATKIGYMEDGIIERLRMLSSIVSLKSQKMDVDGIKITFKPNLPIDRSEIIQQIRDSQEFMPLLVSLGWLDDIDDPDATLEMLRKQKEEEIAINQKAFGIMNEHSHSDLEEDEEDDFDNNKKKQST